jgi:hypothetical protein
MRFRRIYWVTEQLDESGAGDVTGVFTSIPDLLDSGIGIRDCSNKKAGFRLTLVELDANKAPLLVLSAATFLEAKSMLAPFVESGEITEEESVRLAEALRHAL